MKYGETISVQFNIQNNGNQDLRTDEVKITAMSIFQRGEIHKTIGQFKLSPRTIEPGQSKFFHRISSIYSFCKGQSRSSSAEFQTEPLVT